MQPIKGKKETAEKYIEEHLIKDFDKAEGWTFQYIHKDIALEAVKKAREEGYVEGWNDACYDKPHKYLEKLKQEEAKLK